MGRRKRGDIPELKEHKATGRAYVYVGGKSQYFGPWGSAEAKRKYDEFRIEWLQQQGRGQTYEPPTAGVTVTNLVAAFMGHASRYYASPEGLHTTEYHQFQYTVRPLLDGYGGLGVNEFRQRELKALRERLIEAGLCLRTINARVRRVKQIFRWGVESELVDAATMASLSVVRPLPSGTGIAPENPPVAPVDDATIEAILPHLASRQLQTMVKLQRLAGIRPGEVTTMRTGDITQGGVLVIRGRAIPIPDGIWTYMPRRHKGTRRGNILVYCLGPQAQALLKPWLRDNPEEYLFQPREAMNEWREQQRQARGGRRSYYSRGKNARKPAHFWVGQKYKGTSYVHALWAACDRAFPPPAQLRPREGETYRAFLERLTPAEKAELKAWRKAHRAHPHQLRHSTATAIDAIFGLERASNVLGHASTDTTLIYVQRSLEGAAEVMRQMG